MAANLKQSYWNGNSQYQKLADALQKLIPAEGPVANINRNRALEKFRKAVNCYYDLYNNGLCNRARGFAAIFRIAPMTYGSYRGGYSPYLFQHTEEKMDEFVLAAAKEQNISI